MDNDIRQKSKQLLDDELQNQLDIENAKVYQWERAVCYLLLFEGTVAYFIGLAVNFINGYYFSTFPWSLFIFVDWRYNAVYMISWASLLIFFSYFIHGHNRDFKRIKTHLAGEKIKANNIHPLRFFWNNPYPESMMWVFFYPFRKRAIQYETQPVSNFRYRVVCFAAILISMVLLVLVYGTQQNMLEFFVDMPFHDGVSFSKLVDSNENVTYLYEFMSPLAIAITVYLIKLFGLHGKEDKIFSINGILFALMTVFSAALVDYYTQQLVLWFYHYVYPILEAGDGTGLSAFEWGLSIILCFVIQDTVSMIMSAYVSMYVIRLLGTQFLALIPSTLALFLLVTVVLHFIIFILERIGLWRRFVKLLKCFYVPKYLMLAVMSIYTLGGGVIVTFFLYLRKREKKKRDDRLRELKLI